MAGSVLTLKQYLKRQQEQETQVQPAVVGRATGAQKVDVDRARLLPVPVRTVLGLPHHRSLRQHGLSGKL